MLDEIDDINIFNDEYEETVLSEVLQNVKSSENGYKIPIIVQHFINKGYDVTINKGRNGGYALSRLLWSSHDKYILDAAVILIEAGSAITYENGDGSDGVLGDLDCKLAV
jgi:hypothetical protein